MRSSVMPSEACLWAMRASTAISRSQTLVAAGVSDTPMGRKQKHLGLNRLQLANRGRLVQVFETGRSWHTGHQDEDPEELPGIKYGLEIYAPVGPGGHFLETVELFGGQRVFDANPKIEDALRERGRLWHREAFAHQYPHCWRCHNPVIFLATAQWFIAMDPLREPISESTRSARWLPEGIGLMEREIDWLRNMGDWMISKKRYYGLALPIWECTACDGWEVIGSKDELPWLTELVIKLSETFVGYFPFVFLGVFVA